MKVRDLQELLSKLDPQLEVLCYSEDEKLFAEGRGFILFDVLAVSAKEAEHLRLDDQTPFLKFGGSAAATSIVIVEVTADF